MRFGGSARPSVGVDHTRDWKRRWHEIESAAILGPQPGGISDTTIHAARADLEAFYVECFHLRDHLANDASVPLNRKQIDDAINATPPLALVADLANVGKHAVLHYTLHSGHEPTIVSEGATSGDGDGWRLKVEVDHAGSRLDGVTVANDAVAAWKARLTSWGLL